MDENLTWLQMADHVRHYIVESTNTREEELMLLTTHRQLVPITHPVETFRPFMFFL